MMFDTNARILIIDDAEAMRQVIKTVLKQMGFTNVQEAEDGIQALDLLKKWPFDLVITDWHMPGVSRIELSPNNCIHNFKK